MIEFLSTSYGKRAIGCKKRGKANQEREERENENGDRERGQSPMFENGGHTVKIQKNAPLGAILFVGSPSYLFTELFRIYPSVKLSMERMGKSGVFAPRLR
jgi:hypothetical protein